MRDKPAQDQLALILIGMAQGIVEGRLAVTDFASRININGESRIKFSLMECGAPVEQPAVPEHSGDETRH